MNDKWWRLKAGYVLIPALGVAAGVGLVFGMVGVFALEDWRYWGWLLSAFVSLYLSMRINRLRDLEIRRLTEANTKKMAQLCALDAVYGYEKVEEIFWASRESKPWRRESKVEG